MTTPTNLLKALYWSHEGPNGPYNDYGWDYECMKEKVLGKYTHIVRNGDITDVFDEKTLDDKLFGKHSNLIAAINKALKAMRKKYWNDDSYDNISYSDRGGYGDYPSYSDKP